ncbi:MAG: hypothetical protein AAF721_10645, partial [Myxococcota bacterium]
MKVWVLPSLLGLVACTGDDVDSTDPGTTSGPAMTETGPVTPTTVGASESTGGPGADSTTDTGEPPEDTDTTGEPGTTAEASSDDDTDASGSTGAVDVCAPPVGSENVILD